MVIIDIYTVGYSDSNISGVEPSRIRYIAS